MVFNLSMSMSMYIAHFRTVPLMLSWVPRNLKVPRPLLGGFAVASIKMTAESSKNTLLSDGWQKVKGLGLSAILISDEFILYSG